MSEPAGELFEVRMDLPSDELKEKSKRLVGFEDRYGRLQSQFILLTETEKVKEWAVRNHGEGEVLSAVLTDRAPLVIFCGDVGTGKTTTAEACADALSRHLKVEGFLLKLSTKVRGTGHVGEMSSLIGDAFDKAVELAGIHRFVALIIDEGDAVAFNRGAERAHHEDRVGVNTLIQKIDMARELNGRLMIILCTNRYGALDPAIIRRASLVEVFDRPGVEERRQLFSITLSGVVVEKDELEKLIQATGPVGDHPGFTYSDIQTRLIPEAVGLAYPDRPLVASDLLSAAEKVTASPVVFDGE